MAFWFPIVSHFLARPDDHISLSFIGTIGAQLISYILIWLGRGDNLNSSLITSLGGLIYFVLVVYVILVCLLTEKRNPYQPRCAQPPCSRSVLHSLSAPMIPSDRRCFVRPASRLPSAAGWLMIWSDEPEGAVSHCTLLLLARASTTAESLPPS